MDSKELQFGIVIMDASTAEFNFCLLEDDKERTQLETLIIQLKPKEIIYEKVIIINKIKRIIC